ncbi:MAG TPA: hypothetical protein VK858_08680 [Longimicrobiales bacterium]|nr:hypothetical protein [Longimicrobiales bacterium]
MSPSGSDRPDPDLEAGEPPPESVSDPAHRVARWVMVLAPVVLGVLVYLLLRLSTR